MFKKLLSLFMCFISIIFMTNQALAIEKNRTIVDSYKPELTSFLNVSENSEPIYLARERNSRNSETKEMSWAWIGSFFITGLGQILLGEVLRGLLFIGSAIAGSLIFSFALYNGSLGLIYALAIQIWSIFDAYGIAKRQSEGNDEEARLLNERIAQLEKTFNKISIDNNRLNYSLVKF